MSLTCGLVPKVYPLLEAAVETGIAHGVRRVAELTTNLDSGDARTILAEEVLNAICERFDLVDSCSHNDSHCPAPEW